MLVMVVVMVVVVLVPLLLLPAALRALIDPQQLPAAHGTKGLQAPACCRLLRCR